MIELLKRIRYSYYLRKRGWKPLPAGRWCIAGKWPVENNAVVVVNSISDAIFAQQKYESAGKGANGQRP